MMNFLHKGRFALLVIFFAVSLTAFAQPGTSVTFEDNFPPAFNLGYNGQVNGKAAYSGDAGDGFTRVDIEWSGTRWEIFYAFGTASRYVAYASTVNTLNNPPDLATGNYTDENMGDGNTLEGLSGNGTTNIVLPVALIHFSGLLHDKETVLKWQTASELNNEGFHIERSMNGTDFRAIGFVRGNGTTETAQDYTFTDRDLQPGFVYHYRLKQIDFDGAFEYSKQIVLTVKGRNLNVGELFPNPANDGAVQIHVTTTTDGQQPVVITDLIGRVLQREQVQVQDGFNVLSLDVSNLPLGTYLVRIGTGPEVAHRKLVVF